MTVTSTLTKISYAGDGATTQFSFAFALIIGSDLDVFITDATGVVTQLASNLYTVTQNAAVLPNPTPIGGFVVYPISGSALAIGNTITILRSLNETQPTSLANQGTLYQPVIEQALDRSVMIDQQVNELVGRNLTVQVSDPTPGLIPSATARANKVLGFDSSGNPTAVVTTPAGTISSAMAPVCAAATIAAAQALLNIQTQGYLPVGAEFDFPGLAAPQSFFLELGQNVSRASFPELLAVCAPVITATINITNPVITMPARADGLQPTTGIFAGMKVEKSGTIPPGTSILSLTNTTITLTANPTANDTSFRLFLYGNGDGSTTYGLPDGRGYEYAGLDPQNGTTRMTKSTTQGCDASGLGNTGGEQAHTNTLGETAVHNHGITDPTHTHSVPSGGGSFGVTLGAGGNAAAAGTGQTTGAASTGITINNSTPGGGAHNNVQPTSVRNKIIFAGRNTF